jgi:hypothetical protein
VLVEGILSPLVRLITTGRGSAVLFLSEISPTGIYFTITFLGVKSHDLTLRFKCFKYREIFASRLLDQIQLFSFFIIAKWLFFSSKFRQLHTIPKSRRLQIRHILIVLCSQFLLVAGGWRFQRSDSFRPIARSID